MKALNQSTNEDFTAYHGDCVECSRALPDNSIDYSIFSPPFASLYTYSASDRDMGNSKNHGEFYEHYKFLIAEQLRVLKPGRLLSFHCMNLPTSKAHNGYIGISDFRGKMIRLYEDAGFIYHSEVTIWKDPVTAMQRTKALGLLYKQLRKDSAMSRQGIPDYLVTMRKPGPNPEPVNHFAPEEKGATSDKVFRVEDWQKFASPVYGDDLPCDVWMPGTLLLRDNEGVMADRFPDPVWMDINPSETLQFRSAREHNDERHICVARGSMVLTRRGHVEIQDVNVGDMVLTHMGRWRPVVAKQNNGVKPIVTVEAQGVPDLATTPDHRFWARSKTGVNGGTKMPRSTAMNSNPAWMRADSILASYVNLKLPPIEETEYSEHEWWIVGRWLGDGHLDARGGIHITCAATELRELLEELGEKAGFIHRPSSSVAQVRISDPRGYMRNLIYKCGIGCEGKFVPVEGLTLNQDCSEALLSGYLSADGHFVSKYNRWTASSVSKSLMLGMAMVAQRARGVVASVYAGRPPGECTIEGRTMKTRQDWILSIPPRNLSAMILEDGGWKKVRSVQLADDCEVWDLQVEEDESFTVEGCIVHNCPLQLEVIRRGIRLWTNPRDVVMSPFMGIGSEGYVAIQENRRFVGIELKPSYYKQAVANLESARIASPQLDLGLG